MEAEGTLLLFVHLLNAVYVLIALIHPLYLVVNGSRSFGVLDVACCLVSDSKACRILLEGAGEVVKGGAAAHFLQFLLDVHHHHALGSSCLRGRGFTRLGTCSSCRILNRLSKIIIFNTVIPLLFMRGPLGKLKHSFSFLRVFVDKH